MKRRKILDKGQRIKMFKIGNTLVPGVHFFLNKIIIAFIHASKIS